LTKKKTSTFKTGEFEYFESYLKILRDQWGEERVIWLDAGDLFVGGLESKLTEGQIMMDSLQALKVGATTIGNLDFNDYYKLESKLKQKKFPYISAYLQKNHKKYPNTEPYKIFTLSNGIKIAVIGLATKETSKQTSSISEGVTMDGDYAKVVLPLAKELRAGEGGVNAVILLAYVGVNLNGKPEQNLKLQMWNKDNSNIGELFPDNELNVFLNGLEPEHGIDAVVGGNMLGILHQWVNGIPVIQSGPELKNTNIMYLTFNEKELTNIQIEGPIPICEKVFSFTKRCDPVPFEKKLEEDFSELVEFTFHGKKIFKS
jgi:2',3'-cyclic-nucleotide 2'-phosphodiesterase (5'-nucleotidase family)